MSSVLVIKKCPLCGRRYQRVFPTEGYNAWENGTLIQEALSNETADAREFLITGICPECFDSMEVEDD